MDFFPGFFIAPEDNDFRSFQDNLLLLGAKANANGIADFRENIEPLLKKGVKLTYIGVLLKNIQNTHCYDAKLREKAFISTIDQMIGFGEDYNGKQGQEFLTMVRKGAHDDNNPVATATKRLFTDYAKQYQPNKVYQEATAQAYGYYDYIR
jgi:hypothetical protein